MRPAFALCCLLLVAAGAALFGCESKGSDAATAALVRVADKDDIPTLDPARGYDAASWQFEDMLFDTLLDYDDAGMLAPELANHWEVADDGLTYTFTLRPEARFSNGRPLTADDARLAIERVLAPATQSPGAEFYRGIVGAESCQSWPCGVAGLSTPAPNLLRIQLRAVDPLFLHKMALPFSAPIPKEVVEARGDDFGRHPVGVGPFVLDEWRPGERLVFTRNPSYYVAGVPKVAGVLRLVGVDDDLGWLKYLSGQLDITPIPPPEFPAVIHDPAFAPLLRKVTTMRTQYMGLNCALPPFTDRRVRQALNYAVNKEKLLRLMNNRGIVADGFVPPNLPGYVSPVHGYPYDPVRARELLGEAGYANGFDSVLWLRNDANTIRLAQSIQQDLALVNVGVQLKPLAWGSFLDAVKRPDLVPMFLLGWEADFPDASNFLDVLLNSKEIGTNNNTGYRNDEVDQLLNRAAHTSDSKQREELLQRVERIAFDDAPWVFLYHPMTYEVVSSRVRDYQLHPLRPPRFRSLWLADEPG